MSWDVMFPMRTGYELQPFRTYSRSVRQMLRIVRPASPASHPRHGSLLSIRLRPALPAVGKQRPVWRVSRACACAPGCARFAAARYARLIARARKAALRIVRPAFPASHLRHGSLLSIRLRPAPPGRREAAPCFARIACVRGRARLRAFRGGAVRAPDCARASKRRTHLTCALNRGRFAPAGAGRKRPADTAFPGAILSRIFRSQALSRTNSKIPNELRLPNTDRSGGKASNRFPQARNIPAFPHIRTCLREAVAQPGHCRWQALRSPSPTGALILDLVVAPGIIHKANMAAPSLYAFCSNIAFSSGMA